MMIQWFKQPDAPQSASDAPPAHPRYFSRIAQWLLLAIVVSATVYGGIRLRHWAYTHELSQACRFVSDIENAWRHGGFVLADARKRFDPPGWGAFLRAYLERYDRVAVSGDGAQFRLDYPPARLLIMSLWRWQMQDEMKPPLRPWSHEIARPLLRLNIFFELLGAAGAFVLAMEVLRRQRVANAVWLALLVAILLWFNPALILDAHVWPQWDAWVLPFYLFAAWFAIRRWWLAAGACVTLGAMFKGQLLITAPLFVLWPLFQMRWRGVLEVIAGAFAMAMLCAAAWMLQSVWAWVVWIFLLTSLGVCARWITRRWRVLYLVGGAALASLLAGVIFGGSFGWLTQGLLYGTNAHPNLTMGPTPNLAALLGHRFGWRLHETMFTLGGYEISTRTLLVLLFAAALTLCAAAVARHDARNDRRLLVALAVPWIAMFALMPQMHERYLVWGAAISALGAGVSLGTSLLHLLVTLFATVPVLTVLLGTRRVAPPPEWHASMQVWHQNLSRTFPDSSWAMLLLAGIFLYLIIAPRHSTP